MREGESVLGWYKRQTMEERGRGRKSAAIRAANVAPLAKARRSYIDDRNSDPVLVARQRDRAARIRRNRSRGA